MIHLKKKTTLSSMCIKILFFYKIFFSYSECIWNNTIHLFDQDQLCFNFIQAVLPWFKPLKPLLMWKIVYSQLLPKYYGNWRMTPCFLYFLDFSLFVCLIIASYELIFIPLRPCPSLGEELVRVSSTQGRKILVFQSGLLAFPSQRNRHLEISNRVLKIWCLKNNNTEKPVGDIDHKK